MKTTYLFLPFLLLAQWVGAVVPKAEEIWVDQSAAPGGTGSDSAPFQTITAGIAAATTGDIVTVKAGIYRETIALKFGTTEHPFTLRAAPGQRVVISGFAPVTGWTKLHDAIYTTTVDWPVRDLFVGYAPQPLARAPGRDKPWQSVATLADAGQQIKTTEKSRVPGVTGGFPFLFGFVSSSNTELYQPVDHTDAAANSVTLRTKPEDKPWLRFKVGDRFLICNHVNLICQAGDWAYEPVANHGTKLYYWPATTNDLNRTQARQLKTRLVLIESGKNQRSHCRVEGLEITGGAGLGIEISRADDVTVDKCIIHNNAGNGIFMRRSQNIRLTHSLVLGNANGIGIASSSNVVVEANEVAFNLTDGIDVAGNVTGQPGGEPTTSDVTLRRNYFHHHMFLGHPDNMQTYRGVYRLVIEENLALFGGQALMTEDTENSIVRGNVLLGTGARLIIFGHHTSHQWVVTGNTLGFGGWGSIGMDGHDYQVDGNIFYGNGLPTVESCQDDYNLFWLANPDLPLIVTAKHTTYNDLAQYAKVTGQEQHSLAADPLLRNVPARQGLLERVDECSPNHIYLRQLNKLPAQGFKTGDHIEINGDGVVRRVTATDADSISFEPPLPSQPFREALIWNWGQRTDFALDTRPGENSPALKAGQSGQTIGATLDAAAYRRGDFNGAGNRALPVVPADLQAAWPNPNDPLIPSTGP